MTNETNECYDTVNLRQSFLKAINEKHDRTNDCKEGNMRTSIYELEQHLNRTIVLFVFLRLFVLY